MSASHPKSGGADPQSHEDGPSTSRTDDEIEEDIASISEQISFEDSHIDAPSNEALQMSAQAKKRQLFAFSDDEDGSVPIFKMDDSLLDGGRIAEHFREEVASDVEAQEVDSLDGHIDTKGLLEHTQPSHDEHPNPPSTHFGSPVAGTSTIRSPKSQKEISPFHDDVILLNNDKISLTSLKNSQLPLPPIKLPPLKLSSQPPHADENPSSATTTNQNTTNDISEIGRDDADDLSLTYLADPTIQQRVPNSKSLDEVKRKESDSNVHARSLHDSFKFTGNFSGRSDGEESKDSSYEADQSIEELMVSNASMSNFIKCDESANVFGAPVITHSNMIPIATEVTVDEPGNMVDDSLEYESDGMCDFKQRILTALPDDVSDKADSPEPTFTPEYRAETAIEVKKMEKVEIGQQALDDISETTEPSNDVTLNTDHSNVCAQNASNKDLIEKGSFVKSLIDNHSAANEDNVDSVISLKMLHAYEERIKELEHLVETKDASMDALNLQLSRRGSLKEGVCESCSMVTSSTEYRTYQEEYFPQRHDLNQELVEREHLIEQLTDSLQQSKVMNDQLQVQSDRLSAEVTQLRKQLADSADAVRRPLWMRGDHDLIGGGQRISEISIDLVSESDADEVEDKAATRINPDQGDSLFETNTSNDANPITRELMETFQQNLSAEELPIFAAVKTKFDQFLHAELDSLRMLAETDAKIVRDNLLAEKLDNQVEINRLRQLLANTKGGSPNISDLRRELDSIHGREMENLRTYFERKCADLEKQYSAEVFSQHSRRHSNDSGSELSDAEHNLPHDTSQPQSHQGTPKRRSTISDVYASPTHRKITPTSLGDLMGVDDCMQNSKSDEEKDPEPTIQELESFYRDKIADLNKNHEDVVRMLKFRLRRFENRNADDEYMSTAHRSSDTGGGKKAIDASLVCAEYSKNHTELIDQRRQSSDDDNRRPDDEIVDDEDDRTSLKDIVAVASMHNDSHVIAQIIEEYEMRLKEQVTMAKEDIVQALEEQIQALLSETATDDSQWPPELILLREKFTAKSQLEIAQLQIAHKEEMDRLKAELDIVQSRKHRRNTTFDENRDLDQIVQERDNLRELSHTFRWLLSELAKCVSVCEDDLNDTLLFELQAHGIDVATSGQQVTGGQDLAESQRGACDVGSTQSLDTSVQQRVIRLVPDVSGILSLIEDPSLVDFVDQHSTETSFNLNVCVGRLKTEAMQLLEITEEMFKKKRVPAAQCALTEKADSCEEEDGLKSKSKKRSPLKHNSSLNESILSQGQLEHRIDTSKMKERHSLPGHLVFRGDDDNRSLGHASELSSQVNEFKNRLLVSEAEKEQLKVHLDEALKNHDNLSNMLSLAKQRLEILESQKEDISEGYGNSQLQSPSRQIIKTTYTDLQNTARSILVVTPDTMDGTVLLQQIEDFCNQLDRFVEEEKQHKNDLQEQIDAAYKQKKTTSKLLEEQASEWQEERDDFTHEIETLSAQLRDREKKCTAYGHVVKEYEHMEQQIKDMTLALADYKEKSTKQEFEQKAHIDKIFVLREVIADLETQIETKSFNENALAEKIKTLEMYVTTQNHTNVSLHEEVAELKEEYVVGYGDKIAKLEEQLRTARPSGEHQLILDQITSHLKQIEKSLDKKTQQLESLHSDTCSASCSTPTEDVSKGGASHSNQVESNPNSPSVTPRSPHYQPLDFVQRVLDKLVKHNRAEEAAVKRIRDLEMQLATVRTGYDELQNDRDILQDKMSEQILRISSLQSRLDEQRHRAEELHRQDTSDLNLKVYDLQTQLTNAQEKLTAQDKQIATLKGYLEQSKQIIDRQESDLAKDTESSKIARLEADLKVKSTENHRLKEKMRIEIALPDLMETLLSEKNEELDHLSVQLAVCKQRLQVFDDLQLSEGAIAELMQRNRDTTDGKLSARTLSDIVSLHEFNDESDIIRKAPESTVNNEISSKFFASCEWSKPAENTPFSEPSPIEPLHMLQSPIFAENLVPRPRQINFSLPAENNRTAQATTIEGTPSSLSQGCDHGEQIANLQSRLAAMADVESQMTSLKIKMDELQTEKSTVAAELNRHRDLASSLKLDIAAKSQMIADVLNEKRSLQTELNDVRLSLNIINSAQVEANVLQERLDKQTKEIDELQRRFEHKGKEVDELRKELECVSANIAQKDNLLSKLEKDKQNWAQCESNYQQRIIELQQPSGAFHSESEARLQEELEATKTDLFEKLVDCEKLQLDVQQLRSLFHRQQESNLRPDAMDEIAQCVEKELNYSAHLDSSILKAIESDDVNSDEDFYKQKQLIQRDNDALHDELQVLQQKYEVEQRAVDHLQKLLDVERNNSGSLQQQDAHIIDAMRQRLEAAVEHEAQMERQLDEERAKVERLNTQLLVQHRSLSRENSFLVKSPPESPRRTPRMSDMESELVGRLQSEVKLLTAQNDREKERLTDTERVLEREKNRFEKELADRRDYGECIKRELDRVLEEKEKVTIELESAQQQLQFSAHEVANLESRVATMQDAETRRATRRGKERNEITQHAVDVQELRLKLVMVERERDTLRDKCNVLRGDIERGAQREAHLTDVLVKEHSGEGVVPQQFLQKLANIAENTKEYRQMAETLQLLTQERQTLQQRVDDMELRNRAFNRDELEKRANHLFGKYLRVESFRKALVHQKRYLLIMLQTYQENEAKALAMLNGKYPVKPKKKSFRTAVLVVIAIERMKYIVKRWQTGKRVGSDAIFSHQPPRRSASATTNSWARANELVFNAASPPCRDRPHHMQSRLPPTPPTHGRPLQSPALIAECSERLESAAATSRHWKLT